MPKTSQCPCGSDQIESDCCQPYLEGSKTPPTAEALLRSRYTAFTQGNADYIVSTHHSRTRHEVDRKEIEAWAKNSQWLGLKIDKVDAGGPEDDKGSIVFHALYRADGKDTDHYERSHFEKEDGEWRFLEAATAKHDPIRRAEPKTGRNAPCPCGSGKKHKKCCG